MQVAGRRGRVKTPLDARRLQPELQLVIDVGNGPFWRRRDVANDL
jgi:hypothetical protein